MWLIILAFAAVIATLICYSKAKEDKYMFKLLCLILWGATIMILVDRVIGYLMNGREFFELTLDATALGFTMLTAALIIWGALLIKNRKNMLCGKAGK